MSPRELLDFLRRELLPTPGRSGATLRVTLACLITGTLVMMFRMPGSLIAFVLIILTTQEDTAATVLVSVLGWITLTISMATAFLALDLSLDIPWLRICFIAAFIFVGLFMKRALTVGPIGSAFGVPGFLAMMLPDISPPSAEVIVEGLVWLWWCATLGLAVNALVQLLLSPGDPLSLLRRELDVRLRAVEDALRRRAGEASADPPHASLDTLSVAGMTRPAAFLRTASLVDPWARARHESLAALITLADRLVTAASALETLAIGTVTADEAARLRRAADGCRRLRQGLREWQRPPSAQWVALSPEPASAQGSPLADVERTLDEIALAVPGAGVLPAHRPSFFVPDAFSNRDYLRFATKGTLAALICYFTFIGFDYPEIYTCVITVFVVALSTAGASNQKGILRFGGATVGGAMGLVALMYLLPDVDTIGGFLLVFGAGCSVAAWVNAGTPRIAYGGYQVGLAFWKATLQGFGMALSAQVLRDRLIGIAFGLVVFGLVEHLLWPTRAAHVLRARFAEMLRLLADLARSGEARTAAEIDRSRLLISQKVEEIQGLIESSKFESGARDLEALQKATGEAQAAFLLLLSLARHHRVAELDRAVAKTLETVAESVAGDGTSTPPDSLGTGVALEDAIQGSKHAVATVNDDSSGDLYRSLVAAVRRLAAPIHETLGVPQARPAQALAVVPQQE